MRKITSFFVLLAFVLSCVTPPNGFAQTLSAVGMMPPPGTAVLTSPAFTPAHLKGMVVNPADPFKFDFIINRGDEPLSDDQKKAEYTKLIKYFLASLAVPEGDQWVNLSPYEQDRMIADNFGQTEMGRDLLAQDYLLKQISSSLTNPDTDLGKKFWDGVYAQAYEKFGTTEILADTFNKVWIMPDKAVVFEQGNAAYVLESHLKVMMEKDYLATKENAPQAVATQDSEASLISQKVMKEVIIPAIEKEVNEGKNFAPLRQVYSGMLLATWYKIALKGSILGQLYADKSKVKGVDQDPKNNKEIYGKYVEAFKKGVFDMIKEDVDSATQEVIPRKYFSGGTAGYLGAQVQSDIKTGSVALQQVEAIIAKGKDDFISAGAVADKNEAASVVADANEAPAETAVVPGETRKVDEAEKTYTPTQMMTLTAILFASQSGIDEYMKYNHDLQTFYSGLSLEWDKGNLDVFEKMIQDAPEVFKILVGLRTHNRQVMGQFEKANPDRSPDGILNPLAEETHNAWLDGMRKTAGFVEYTADLHSFLLGLIDAGVVTGITHDDFIDSSKKHKIKPGSFNLEKMSQEDKEKLNTYVKDQKEFVINTVSGTWQELSKITGWKVTKKDRPSFLYGLQADSVGAILSALSNPVILRGLGEGDATSKMAVIVDLLRRINVGWRLNNPWDGIDAPLLGKPFALAEDGGIGIDDIKKDADVLKAILEKLLSAIKENKVVLDPMVKEGLETAFNNGLGDVLTTAVDKELLAAAVKANPVKDTFTLDTDPIAHEQVKYDSKFMSLLAFVFGSESAIQKNAQFAFNLVKGLSLEWEKDNLDVFEKMIQGAPKFFKILVAVRSHNRMVMGAFEKVNPDRSPDGILNPLAEATHNAWLDGMRKTAGFVEYTADLHSFLLGLIDAGVVTGITHDDFIDSSKKHKIKPGNFNLEKMSQEDKEKLNTYVKDQKEFVINTVSGTWQELSKITGWKVTKKDRPSFLYGLQADSVGAILSALSNPEILRGLGEGDATSKMTVVVDLLRRINVGWRLNNPWDGVKSDLLGKPFALAEDGGIGIDDIKKDADVLKAILEKLLSAIKENKVVLDPMVKEGLETAFNNGLGDVLTTAVDKELLAAAVKANPAKETFTLNDIDLVESVENAQMVVLSEKQKDLVGAIISRFEYINYTGNSKDPSNPIDLLNSLENKSIAEAKAILAEMINTYTLMGSAQFANHSKSSKINDGPADAYRREGYEYGWIVEGLTQLLNELNNPVVALSEAISPNKSIISAMQKLRATFDAERYVLPEQIKNGEKMSVEQIKQALEAAAKDQDRFAQEQWERSSSMADMYGSASGQYRYDAEQNERLAKLLRDTAAEISDNGQMDGVSTKSDRMLTPEEVRSAYSDVTGDLDMSAPDNKIREQLVANIEKLPLDLRTFFMNNIGSISWYSPERSSKDYLNDPHGVFALVNPVSVNTIMNNDDGAAIKFFEEGQSLAASFDKLLLVATGQDAITNAHNVLTTLIGKIENKDARDFYTEQLAKDNIAISVFRGAQPFLTLGFLVMGGTSKSILISPVDNGQKEDAAAMTMTEQYVDSLSVENIKGSTPEIAEKIVSNIIDDFKAASRSDVEHYYRAISSALAGIVLKMQNYSKPQDFGSRLDLEQVGRKLGLDVRVAGDEFQGVFTTKAVESRHMYDTYTDQHVTGDPDRDKFKAALLKIINEVLDGKLPSYKDLLENEKQAALEAARLKKQKEMDSIRASQRKAEEAIDAMKKGSKLRSLPINSTEAADFLSKFSPGQKFIVKATNGQEYLVVGVKDFDPSRQLFEASLTAPVMDANSRILFGFESFYSWDSVSGGRPLIFSWSDQDEYKGQIGDKTYVVGGVLKDGMSGKEVGRRFSFSPWNYTGKVIPIREEVVQIKVASIAVDNTKNTLEQLKVDNKAYVQKKIDRLIGEIAAISSPESDPVVIAKRLKIAQGKDSSKISQDPEKVSIFVGKDVVNALMDINFSEADANGIANEFIARFEAMNYPREVAVAAAFIVVNSIASDRMSGTRVISYAGAAIAGIGVALSILSLLFDPATNLTFAGIALAGGGIMVGLDQRFILFEKARTRRMINDFVAHDQSSKVKRGDNADMGEKQAVTAAEKAFRNDYAGNTTVVFTSKQQKLVDAINEEFKALRIKKGSDISINLLNSLQGKSTEEALDILGKMLESNQLLAKNESKTISAKDMYDYDGIVFNLGLLIEGLKNPDVPLRAISSNPTIVSGMQILRSAFKNENVELPPQIEDGERMSAEELKGALETAAKDQDGYAQREMDESVGLRSGLYLADAKQSQRLAILLREAAAGIKDDAKFDNTQNTLKEQLKGALAKLDELEEELKSRGISLRLNRGSRMASSLEEPMNKAIEKNKKEISETNKKIAGLMLEINSRKEADPKLTKSDNADKGFAKGGIDFAQSALNMQIKRDGKGVPLSIDQQNLDNIKINGLVPIIFKIQPAINARIFAKAGEAVPAAA